MLDKRIINTAVAGVTPSACTTDTVQILDGVPFESIATYQLDGNANDLTTNYNGTASNITYSTGQFGQAAVFNGSSSYIQNSSLIRGAEYSISVWFKTDTASGERIAVGWNWSGTQRFAIGIRDGNIQYQNGNSGWLTILSSASTNTWYNVIITSGSNQYNAYLNGNKIPSASGIGSTPASTVGYGFNLGRFGSNAGFWDGSIDQVRIYNKALSEDNVATLYAETVATASTNIAFDAPSLVAYYKMSDATDESGSYDGTPTNVNFNVAGKFGNAGDFNGSSSKISLGSLNQFSGNTVSFSLWFNSTNASTTKILLGSNVNAIFAGELDLYTYNSGFLLTVATASNAYKQWTTPANLSSNTWHNVVVTLDSGTSEVAKIYLDGNEQTKSILGQSGTISGALLNSASNLNLGVDNVPASYFNGKIDQVRIFNRIITANEAETLYNEVQCVPTIVPASNFETVIYTGTNNSTSVSISSLDFQPDLIIHKCRNDSWSHWVYDSIRGTGGNAELQTNSTATEGGSNNETYGSLGSFDSNGFTSAVGVNDGQYFNGSGKDFVAWCWKAGGPDVLNEEGTIDSQVSANTDAGFSIVTYTGNTTAGATIGHGLNNTPELIIFKRRDANNNWLTVQTTEGVGGYLDLTNTMTTSNYNAWMNNTNPTDTLITLNSYTYINGGNMLAYCFHSVDGMSKVGSYKGTGAVENNIVTGFRPAFVMVKSSSNAEPWFILDNKRDASNPRDNRLMADSSAVESDGSVHTMDFNSNGFTLNGTVGNGTNGSNVSYIYLAIAEEASVPLTRNAIDPFGDGNELALYKFEDDATNSEDSVTASTSNVTYATGYIDKAAVFNNSSSEIVTPNSLLPSSGGFAISWWQKTTQADNTYSYTMDNSGGSAQNGIYIITHRTDVGFIVGFKNSSVFQPSIPYTSAERTQWTHFCVSWDGTTSANAFKIYKNNVPTSFTSSVTNGGGSYPFKIGRSHIGSNWFGGSIDQVRIFNRALDSGEVTQLYNE